MTLFITTTKFIVSPLLVIRMRQTREYRIHHIFHENLGLLLLGN
jgi:hypothetical protein